MSAPTARGRRRLAAAFCALALGAAGVVVAGTAAHAAPGNIDQNATGSLTIHLLKENNATPGAIDGSTPPNPAGTPLVGTFAVYPIASSVFDPADPADWTNWDVAGNALATTANCSAAAAGTDGRFLASTASVTTTGGVGVAPGLSVRAYLVCATAAPQDALLPAPFVATVPSSHNNSWVYNIHAYPKTAVNRVDKTVRTVGDCYAVGCPIEFPVTTVIERLPGGATYSSLIIRDTMDARLTPINVQSVRINGAPVTQGASGYQLTGSSGQTLLVTINPTLVNNSIGQTVEVVFRGVVSTLDTDPIENIAYKYVNDTNTSGTPDPDDPDVTPSPTVRIYYGDAVIAKVDSDAGHAPLAGARFEVYASNTPYAANCASGQPTGSAISVSGTTVFTTVANGKVTVPGLYVTDSDNTPNQSATARCYFVREIQAPAGFVTPTGTAAYTPVRVSRGITTAAYDVQIINTRQAVPTLPLTGGAGQMLAIIGGFSALGLAVTLIVVRRRRTAQV